MASNRWTDSLRAKRMLRCRALLIAFGFAASLAVMIAPVSAQLLSSGKAKGSGRRVDRDNAIAAIPFNKLVPQAAQQIQEVVSSPSVYRKLPVQTIECDQDMFVFLARNPETVVHTWQLMGITALTLDRVGPYRFESSDGAGTDSQIELVYGTPGLHVFYGTGEYEGPLFRNHMTGQCVLVLRSEYNERGDRPVTTCRLDVFIRMPQSAIDVAAKTLHPLFGKAADVNFTETAKFFQRLNTAATKNPDGVERMANRLTDVAPAVRQKMIRVAYDTHRQWGQAAERPGMDQTPVQRVSGADPPSRGRVQRISRLPAGGAMIR